MTNKIPSYLCEECADKFEKKFEKFETLGYGYTIHMGICPVCNEEKGLASAAAYGLKYEPIKIFLPLPEVSRRYRIIEADDSIMRCDEILSDSAKWNFKTFRSRFTRWHFREGNRFNKRGTEKHMEKIEIGSQWQSIDGKVVTIDFVKNNLVVWTYEFNDREQITLSTNKESFIKDFKEIKRN
jgi:hypothetical protein